MTVGDIHCWDVFKDFCYACVDCVVTNCPKSMAKSVGGNKVVFWGIVRHKVRNYFVHFIYIWICKEHRFDIRVLDTHVNHTIVFFVFAGQFVFFNFAGHIVINICRGDQTILCATVHCLRIDIIHFFVVLDQPAVVLPFLEVFDGFVICFLFVFVGNRVKINFRFNNMQ